MPQSIYRKSIVFFFVLIISIVSCNKKGNYSPKPKGYFRIDLPEKNYKQLKSTCPYTFEYAAHSEIIHDPENNGNPCWINIHYPKLNGDIHLSYKKVEDNLQNFIEDSRTLVYKHTIKAESISEHVYSNPERNVYGILYDLKGNVASPMQFFITDSTRHFLRGSLYFRTEPNKDSLAPVINFVEEDIEHLIETLEWKN